MGRGFFGFRFLHSFNTANDLFHKLRIQIFTGQLRIDLFPFRGKRFFFFLDLPLKMDDVVATIATIIMIL